MKVIYEFDTESDKEDLALYQKAEKYHSAIYEVTLAIRNYHKYQEKVDEPDAAVEIKKLKDLLRTINEELSGMGYWE